METRLQANLKVYARRKKSVEYLPDPDPNVIDLSDPSSGAFENAIEYGPGGSKSTGSSFGSQVLRALIRELAVALAKEIATSPEAKEMFFAALRYIINIITAPGRPIGRLMRHFAAKIKKNKDKMPEWASVMMGFEDEEHPRSKGRRRQEEDDYEDGDYVAAAASKAGNAPKATTNPKVREISKRPGLQAIAKQILLAMLKTGVSLETVLKMLDTEMRKNATPKGMKWAKKGGKTYLVPSNSVARNMKTEVLSLLRKQKVDFELVGQHGIKWETEDDYVVLTFAGKGCTVALFDGHPSGRPESQIRLTNVADIQKHLQEHSLFN